MGGIFGQVVGLTAFFTPWLLLAIFLLVLVAEFGVSIPYLMETVWLFSGYSFAVGNISIEHLVMFGAVGLGGRILGASALFYLSWYGKSPVKQLYCRYCQPVLIGTIDRVRPLRRLVDTAGAWFTRLSRKASHHAGSRIVDGRTVRLFGRRFHLSPMTVALGRLMWLRLPITVALGTQKQRRTLLLGVAIFSIVWDSLYLAFGVLGGKNGLEPWQMALYPVAAMTAVSLVVFLVRRLRRNLSDASPVEPAAG